MKNQKFEKRVTGGMSVYYGIGILLTGVAATVGAIVMAVKFFMGSTEHGWGTPAGLGAIGLVMGTLGYLLLRSGYEQLED
ncbi:MAG: hypothetical protein HRU69_05200 [Flammeovirgaceae bacterium]|nr:MAG: hypothetical protein HRU69_05200 [Flammeovirgaceae bacterium]